MLPISAFSAAVSFDPSAALKSERAERKASRKKSEPKEKRAERKVSKKKMCTAKLHESEKGASRNTWGVHF